MATLGEEIEESAADVGKAFHRLRVVTALKNLVTPSFRYERSELRKLVPDEQSEERPCILGNAALPKAGAKEP